MINYTDEEKKIIEKELKCPYFIVGICSVLKKEIEFKTFYNKELESKFNAHLRKVNLNYHKKYNRKKDKLKIDLSYDEILKNALCRYNNSSYGKIYISKNKCPITNTHFFITIVGKITCSISYVEIIL